MKRKMRNIGLLLCFVGMLISCDTKQEVMYTGLSNPYFEGTMMEYLRSDEYNWKLTVQMIERAGLTDLFEGNVDTCSQITFFGPPSNAIELFILRSQDGKIPGEKYSKVADIPEDLCRKYILMHVVKGKFLKKDIAYRNKDYYIFDPKQDGGTDFTCLGGNRIRAYLQGSLYAGVPDAGPVTLYLYSLTAEKDIPMASPDIQPTNGVVHALNYNYDFGKI